MTICPIPTVTEQKCDNLPRPYCHACYILLIVKGVIFLRELISDYDLYLFHQGNHFQSFRMLGAHPVKIGKVQGVRFALWAPRAKDVRVIGEFNDWNGRSHPLKKVKESGIWAVFVPEAEAGQYYKYEIIGADGNCYHKSDPYAFSAELRPKTASRICGLQEDYHWGDKHWQEEKRRTPVYDKPLILYEVHAGSWKRNEDESFYTYRQLAEELTGYAADMGYTHLELLPLAEHPLDASWGYQITGYYSVTSRYGGPGDLKYLVDCCHQKGIGVIMDWVPSHFCRDGHGLGYFDGSTVYEYEDSNRADNRGWGTLNFDLGKPEVMSFLISNAIYWLEIFHIDGLRVDAVASMLYLDYGRKEGEWAPNCFGGRENLQGVSFLKKLNEVVFSYFPATLMMAEESTSWPLVSAPTYTGGLGFNFKWNMGWMNDSLRYIKEDPFNRKWHHNLLTFSLMYAFSENFILPISHDEVVHGKKSLVDKMPGDHWQKFAGVRVFLGYMMTHPGKKLLFMGSEFGQFSEWYEARSLDWHLLDYDLHRKLHFYVKELNHFYRQQEALWKNDFQPEGFTWLEADDHNQSLYCYMRHGENDGETLITVLNFTPVPRESYRLGVPAKGVYKELFNSDREDYGGTGWNNTPCRAEPTPWQRQKYSVQVNIPPLAVVIFKGDNKKRRLK